MSTQLLVTRRRSPNRKVEQFIDRFHLKVVLKDGYETVLENEEMLVSVNKQVLRILVYNQGNRDFISRINKFFYGGKSHIY